MIEFIVAGGGEAAYRYLWQVTQSKNPALQMRMSVIIDVLPLEKLHSKMQEIIRQENITLLTPEEFNGFPVKDNNVGAVLTPHDSHLHYVRLFAARGMMVYAEKPLVSTLAHLNEFLKIPQNDLMRVYAAEYSTEGKGFSFLNAAGLIDRNDPRLGYFSIPENIQELYRELGEIEQIDGKILEGTGTAGTADHRPWLFSGAHGGIVRDLFSHLFGPLYDVGLASSDIINLKVKLGRYDKGMALGTWRPLKSADEGETYAEIAGNFLTPYGTIPFRLEGGKYWPEHDRRTILIFKHGQVKINYEPPFETVIEARKSEAISKFIGDYYPTMAFLDFAHFIKSQSHGHLGRAVATVRFNEQARQAGLEQAGL